MTEPDAENLRSVYAEVCQSYHAIADFRAPKGKAGGLIGAETAGWIVYLTVLAAWCYLAVVGFAG